LIDKEDGTKKHIHFYKYFISNTYRKKSKKTHGRIPTNNKPLLFCISLLFGICNPEDLSADLQSAQNTL
jgi:hypothetical protein